MILDDEQKLGAFVKCIRIPSVTRKAARMAVPAALLRMRSTANNA